MIYILIKLENKPKERTMTTAIEFYSLPMSVQDILATYEDETYEECNRINAELNAIGWSCEYDLGAEIFNVFPLFVVDNNGDKWTRNDDNLQGSCYWTSDVLPIDWVVYCTPFFEDLEGIPFEIHFEDDSEYTFVSITEESNLLEEMKTLFSTVKNKL